MAGTFEEIVDTFERVPSRRLVVLGPAGSGKSVLVRRFALSWLTRESDDEPRRVPVVLSLNTWNPAHDLRTWIVTRLVSEHPALGRRVLSGGTIAKELLDGGHLLPVLDGFDEIAESLRAGADALRELNKAFNERAPVVLTSRPEQYRAAVDEAGVAFSDAAVIRLCPLDAKAVRDYLLASTTRTVQVGERQVPKWEPVLDRPGDTSAASVAQALSTPLMVALARLAYSDTRANPAELLDDNRFAGGESVEQHLLDRLVPAAYESRARWSAADAGRWLAFLARRMNAGGTRELAWWRLGGRGARYAAASALVVLLAGLITTMALLGYGGVATWGIYLLLAPIVVVEAAVLVLAVEVPAPTALGFPKGRLRRLLVRLALCAAVGLPFWALLRVDPVFLALVSFVVVIRGVPRDPLDLSVPTEPQVSLRSDRRATVVLGTWHAVTGGGRRLLAAVVLLAPLALLWLWSHNGGKDSDLTGQWWLVGAVTAVVLFGYGLLASAWGQFQLVRLVRAVRGELPWRVLGFLADAHRRGVLRQTGGVYQFRHTRLQDRLAGTVARTDVRTVQGGRRPALLSLAVVVVGGLTLMGMTALAPGPDGPYLRFAPVCDQLGRELTPFLPAADSVDPTVTSTEFNCFFDEGVLHAASVYFSGEINTGYDGDSAVGRAHDLFGYSLAGKPSSPATAASCGEPVVYNDPGSAEALCGNAELDVQYAEDGASTARLNAVALALVKVLIGVALGDQVPAADNADARAAAIQAIADQPRPVAPNSGSAHYRPGPEQTVTGTVWQPADPTALQDVGAFVFRTPRSMWCGDSSATSLGRPAWECRLPSKSGYLVLNLAVWPCPDPCSPDQANQDWETYFGRQGIEFSDVSWQLPEPQTAWAQSRDQLLLDYWTRTADGTALLVGAAVRTDAATAAVGQKIVNDIRTQAALIAAR